MALYGYLVVAGVFTVFIFVAGFINSFGVFVDQFDRDFCQPNDCLDILGKVMTQNSKINSRCDPHVFSLIRS